MNTDGGKQRTELNLALSVVFKAFDGVTLRLIHVDGIRVNGRDHAVLLGRDLINFKVI